MKRWLAAVALGVAVFRASAGSGYELLDPPRPVEDPTKVEVIEFFSYGCPHCDAFEPILEPWVAKLPEDVVFKRWPVIFYSSWEILARAYFVAETLGVVEKVHPLIFDAVHREGKRKLTRQDLASIFEKAGVKREAFEQAYDSFAVDVKMRQVNRVAGDYGITGVPTLVVQGKYQITGRLAGSFEKMLEVADRLIEQERKALKTKDGKAPKSAEAVAQ